jgi:hypothetical protein
LFLAGVTLTGCENTDWCCWGKKASDPAPVRNPGFNSDPKQAQQKPQPKMWENDPVSRTSQGDPSIVPPTDPRATVPNNPAPRTSPGVVEESDFTPPPVPKSVGGPDLNDPVTPLPDSSPKPPASAPDTTNRSPKIAPPSDSGPALEDLPSLEAPPPPKPIPDGSTKSSSNYQNTPPSLDDPPPPVGVPVIKGGPKGE